LNSTLVSNQPIFTTQKVEVLQLAETKP